MLILNKKIENGSLNEIECSAYIKKREMCFICLSFMLLIGLQFRLIIIIGFECYYIWEYVSKYICLIIVMMIIIELPVIGFVLVIGMLNAILFLYYVAVQSTMSNIIGYEELGNILTMYRFLGVICNLFNKCVCNVFVPIQLNMDFVQMLC